MRGKDCSGISEHATVPFPPCGENCTLVGISSPSAPTRRRAEKGRGMQGGGPAALEMPAGCPGRLEMQDEDGKDSFREIGEPVDRMFVLFDKDFPGRG